MSTKLKLLIWVIGSTVLSVVIAIWAPEIFGEMAERPTRAMIQAECGACHIAFQPRFLSQSAWDVLLANLDSHFGENAHLAPDKVAAIGAYYRSHAGWSKWNEWNQPFSPTAVQPLPRITAQSWWKSGMGKLDVTKPRVRSRANCAACHQNGERYLGVHAGV